MLLIRNRFREIFNFKMRSRQLEGYQSKKSKKERDNKTTMKCNRSNLQWKNQRHLSSLENNMNWNSSSNLQCYSKINNPIMNLELIPKTTCNYMSSNISRWFIKKTINITHIFRIQINRDSNSSFEMNFLIAY